jgi:hypothetical protein
MAILHLRVIKNHNNSNNNVLRWLNFGLLLIAFHCLQNVNAVDLGKQQKLSLYNSLCTVDVGPCHCQCCWYCLQNLFVDKVYLIWLWR